MAHFKIITSYRIESYLLFYDEYRLAIVFSIYLLYFEVLFGDVGALG